MQKLQWKFIAELALIASICTGAVVLVFGAPDIVQSTSGSVIDLNAWTAQDQDDADSVMRPVLVPDMAISLSELEALIELLEREAGDRMRAICADGSCGTAVSAAIAQKN